MKIKEIIEHLKLECPSFQNRVSGAADYDLALESNLFKAPCAYVVPLSTASTPNNTYPAHVQKITMQFGVMMIISNKRDSTGYAAHEELNDVQLEVMNALCGFQPEGVDFPIEHVAGRSSGSYDLNRFWADVFTTSYHFRKMPT